MPREFIQTINAAQMSHLVVSLNSVEQTVTLSVDYSVGQVTKDEEGVPHFGTIQGAANNSMATITVPVATSLLDSNVSLQSIIAQQEGLDLLAGDVIIPPS